MGNVEKLLNLVGFFCILHADQFCGLEVVLA